MDGNCKRPTKSSEPLTTINHNWNGFDIENENHSIDSTSDSSSDNSSDSCSPSQLAVKKRRKDKKVKKLRKIRTRSESSSSESSDNEGYGKRPEAKDHEIRGKWSGKSSTFAVNESKFGQGSLKMRIASNKATPHPTQTSTFQIENPRPTPTLLDTGQEPPRTALSKTAGFHSIQRILMAKEKRSCPGPGFSSNLGISTSHNQPKASSTSQSKVGPRARPTAVVRHSSPSTDSSRSASLERWSNDKDASKSRFDAFSGSGNDSANSARVGLFGNYHQFKYSSVFGHRDSRSFSQKDKACTTATKPKNHSHSSKEKLPQPEDSAPQLSSEGEAEHRARKPRLSRDSISSLSSGICKHSSIVKAIQDGINAAMLLKAYQDKESDGKEKRSKSRMKNFGERRRSKSERIENEDDKVDGSPSIHKGRDFDSGSVSSNSSKKGFSPLFASARRRKRKKKGKVKGFKTKHKNIYDPEFLKDLETIITRISRIPVGSSPGFARPPSIFQRRNYVCPSLLSKRRYANVIRPPICRAFPTPSPVCFDSNYLSHPHPPKKPEPSFARPDSASTRYSITSNLYDFVSSDEESPAPARTSKLSSPGSFSSEASPYGRLNNGRPSPFNSGRPSPLNTGRPSPLNNGRPSPSNNGRPSPLSKDDGSVKSKGDSPASSKSFDKSATAFIAELASERRSKYRTSKDSPSENRAENVLPCSSSFADEDIPLSVRRERRKSEDESKLDGNKVELPSSDLSVTNSPVKEAVIKSPARRGRKPKVKPSESLKTSVDVNKDSEIPKGRQKSSSRSVDKTHPDASVNADHVETQSERPSSACDTSSILQPENELSLRSPTRARSKNTLSTPEPDLRASTTSDALSQVDKFAVPKRRGRPPGRKSETASDHMNQTIELVVISSGEVPGESQPENVLDKPEISPEKTRTRLRRVKKDDNVVGEENSETKPSEAPKIEVQNGEGEKKGKVERKKGEKVKKNQEDASKDLDKNGGVTRRRTKKQLEEETIKVNAVEQHLPLKKRHHHLTEEKADSPKGTNDEQPNSDKVVTVDTSQCDSLTPPEQDEGKGKRGVKRRTADPEIPANSKMISPKKRHLIRTFPEAPVLSCDLVENHQPAPDGASVSDPLPVLPDVIPIMNPVPKITLKIKNIDGAPQVTSVTLKKVKRKKINRTGFPTKKKKKRESTTEPGSTESEKEHALPSNSFVVPGVKSDRNPGCGKTVYEIREKNEVQTQTCEVKSKSCEMDENKCELKMKASEVENGLPEGGSGNSKVEGKMRRRERTKSASQPETSSDTCDKPLLRVAKRLGKVVKSVKLAHLRRKRSQPITRPLRKRMSECEPGLTDEGGPKRSLRRKVVKSPLSDTESIPDGCLPPCDFPSEIGSDPVDSFMSADEECVSPTKRSPTKRAATSRKKYLPAGLFSNHFKDTEKKKRNSESPTKLSSYDSNDSPGGLLPLPLHSVEWTCRRKLTYRLPSDCWSMKEQGLLPGKTLPSWAYKKIRNNVYYDVKPPIDKETHICSCKHPTDPKSLGCGEDCLNRVCYTECQPSLCPVGQACSNQRIQKHQWAQGLQRFMTQGKGFGIKTKSPIKVGDFIVEYTGEVVSESEFRDRMTGVYVSDVHHYCLNLDGGLVIDGHRMGSEARFINHSCSPNCEMQKWNVNGLSRMCVFALRDIKPGEELTYDYNFYLFNPDEGQTCRCAAHECRGVIGGKSQRLPANGTTLGPVINTRSGKAIKTKGELKAMPKSPPKQLVKQQRSKINEEDEGLKDMRRIHIQYLKPIPRLYEEDIPCIQEKRCFLIRNYEKVRRKQQKLIEKAETRACKSRTNDQLGKMKGITVSETVVSKLPTEKMEKADHESAHTAVSSIQHRSDDETSESLQTVFKRIVTKVLCLKDEFGTVVVTMLADAEKSFRKVTDDVTRDVFKSPALFDSVVRDIFRQLFVMFPLNSVLGRTVLRLKTVYYEAKHCEYRTLETLLGHGVPAAFISDGHPNISKPEEEVVVCLCSLPHDEGLMVQCESCETWQHASCVKVANPDVTYNCFKCTNNFQHKDRCVVLQPQPDDPPPGHVFYLSYVSRDLHLKQGDHVYVLRDHDTIGLEERLYGPEYENYDGPLRQPGVLHGDYQAKQLDIFLIERIFKDEKDKVFVYGHHYLRPHETYHEPSRRFYPNEVLHMPLYEAIPIWAVIGRCWVLDLNIYCKGRPRESVEDHVYLCELRVDKLARMFSKCPKPKFPYSTKNFAFKWFDTKLRPVKNYQPHPSEYPVAKNTSKPKTEPAEVGAPPTLASVGRKKKQLDNDEEVPLAKVREEVKHVKLFQKRERLDRVAIRLLAKRATKEPPLDASYLLDRKRQKKKLPTETSKDVPAVE